MPLEIVVTNAGRAALVNAQNTGTNPVTITQVGLSSTAIAPLPTLTALAGEFKRMATVSGEVVADDTIHLSMMDSSADAYTLRSIGIYLADGTLFAVYGQPAAILEKTASSDGALSVDIIFADISAALLTFGDASFVNPPATTERQGVVELATLAEAQAGFDALRALTPTTAKASILGWLLAQDGAGSGLDADLLDGKDSSWFTDVIARLGYSPVNRAGDTMSGLLTLSGNPTANGHAANKQYTDALVTAAALLAKLLTVDGAGSGLDADLLDGKDSSWFTDIIARLGFVPLNAASYTALDVRAKLLSVDGSGSGIDADFLRGIDLASFARKDLTGLQSFAANLKVGTGSASGNEGGEISLARAPGGTASGDPYIDIFGDAFRFVADKAGVATVTTLPFGNGTILREMAGNNAVVGYSRLSNNVVEQWGSWVSSASPGGAVNVNFPVQFGGTPYSVQVTPIVTGASAVSAWTSDGITAANFPGRCSTASIRCLFHAIGPA